MTVPRQTILDRLDRNVDNLLESGERLIRSQFISEIYSPFRDKGKSGEASPFLKSLFPEIRVAAMLERSLNTALGWGWDKIVAEVARATHGNAEFGHLVTGQIPAVAINRIDAICIDYTSGGGHSTPNTRAELAQIIPLLADPGKRDDVREKSDVFYVSQGGIEHYFEMKTPKPNYDQLRAAKRRILNIHAVRHPTAVRAMVGMAYNPNGYFSPYGWPTTPFFMDVNVDLMIGKDLWNYVGDSPSTYDELLDCFHAISVKRRQDLTRLLEQAD